MPPPPFFGGGLSDADDAWQIVRVRGEARTGERPRPQGRPSARRWQAVEVGFEEWGRGALVLVGTGRQPRRRTAKDRPAGGAPTVNDGSRGTPPAVDGATAGRDADRKATLPDVELVALALETIALRVRVGEFRVRGLVPGMTDAAILAATLASILTPTR